MGQLFLVIFEERLVDLSSSQVLALQAVSMLQDCSAKRVKGETNRRKMQVNFV